jgi:enediyne biosynthesis protein E4
MGGVRWVVFPIVVGCFVVACGCNSQSELSPRKRIERSSTRAVQRVDFSGAQFRELDLPPLRTIRYRTGREEGKLTILEIVGGGVALFDYDGDGWPDLFFPGGGSIDSVARNIEGAASTLLRGGPEWNLRDVTGESGTEVAELYSHGATVADYTHDGFADLLVYGYQGVRLLRNQGDGTFLDVTVDAGLTHAPWTTAAAWGDVDGDGELDLYLGSYLQWDLELHRICASPEGLPDVCSPTVFHGGTDAFFPRYFGGTFHGRFSGSSR